MQRPSGGVPERRATGLPRSHGRAKVAFGCTRDAVTRLQGFFQEGCLKVRVPHASRGSGAELVLINTAGGLTGGDDLATAITVERNADVTVTTPGGERVYRSAGGEAVVEQHLEVRRHGRLDWLPQETILFDDGRLRRRLHANLEGDAQATIAESILLGRAAMGESVVHGLLNDFWTVRRDGALVFADATHIADGFASTVAHTATLAGCIAFATVVHAGSALGSKLDAIRGCGVAEGVTVGASLIGELVVARFVAANGMALRRAMTPVLAILRNGRPLPRLWSY